METALRNLTRERAGNRCEYCHLHQDDEPYFRFHIEHVVSTKHGGSNDAANLALACRHCNLHKGPNVAGIDRTTGTITRLFHPRADNWNAHFAIIAAVIHGLTPVGRTTVDVLAMNDEDRIQLRLQLSVLE